jgi:hypothetical protein
MANFYQTDDINFSIPFDFVSEEFNGVTTDVHKEIPDLILNYVRQIRPRHYDSFSQAAAENAASRIFLGIHWRFDAINGIDAGDRIGDIDFDTELRPKNGGGSTHVATVDFVSQIDAYLKNTYLPMFPGSGPTGVTPFGEPIAADIVGLVAPGSVQSPFTNTTASVGLSSASATPTGDVSLPAPVVAVSGDAALDQSLSVPGGAVGTDSSNQASQLLALDRAFGAPQMVGGLSDSIPVAVPG